MLSVAMLPATSIARTRMEWLPAASERVAVRFSPTDMKDPLSTDNSKRAMPDPRSWPLQDRVTFAVPVPGPVRFRSSGAVVVRFVSCGAVVSILTPVECGTSTLPTRSTDCTSTVCTPSVVITNVPTYGRQAPPSIRYCVMATPARESCAVRVTDTEERFQPFVPEVPCRLTVVMGGIPSTNTYSVVFSNPSLSQSHRYSKPDVDPWAVLDALAFPVTGDVVFTSEGVTVNEANGGAPPVVMTSDPVIVVGWKRQRYVNVPVTVGVKTNTIDWFVNVGEFGSPASGMLLLL